MALYRPPTRVSSIQVPYLALVTSNDPQFERRKHREVEYEVSSGRVLLADPYTRGSFSNHSNVYPVGQQYGADDPLIVAARPMFSGTPDGRGWA